MQPDFNPEPSTSRKERERLLRREAILEAARIEFAEKGYGPAKLEDIARRAEFGKGTLYNYFKGGKLGMLFAIFDQLFESMTELIEKSFSVDCNNKSFRDCLYDYTVSCLTFYVDRKELFLILVKEAHRMCFGDDFEHMTYFRNQRERMVSAFALSIKRAIEKGEVRPLDPHAIAHMILGNIEGFQVHLILESDTEGNAGFAGLNPEKAAGFLTTMLLDGLSANAERPEFTVTTNQRSHA